MNKNHQTRLVIFLVASLACVILFSLASYKGLAAPSGQVVRSATPTRTALVTPTPTALVQVLQRQLVFGGLGGGMSDPGVMRVYLDCLEEPPSGTKLPAIISLKRSDSEFGGLCLYGFPQNEVLTLRFTSPDRRSDVSGVFRKGEYEAGYEVYMLEQVKPAIGSMAGGVMGVTDAGNAYTGGVLWMPEGLSEGGWEVEARTARLTAKTSFQVQWGDKTPRLHIVQPKAAILSRPADYEMFSGMTCSTVTANDRFKIVGANFPTNRTIPLGLYRKDERFSATLVNQTRIQTDRLGNYRDDWSISPRLPAGHYFLVGVLDAQSGELSSNPAVCVMVSSWQACPNTLASRLGPNMSGKVLEDPPQANSVRATASRSGKVIGKIQPGERFLIRSGPECSGGWVWWYVETPKGLKGWTPEGNEKMYWLGP